jgi:hypothetical protein
VLCSFFILIYINDLDNGTASKISNFVYDTKLYRQVGAAEDIAKLRNDLEKCCLMYRIVR